MSDLSVATDALRSDAVVWDEAAHRLDGPRNVVASLHLTAADVMCYAANKGLDRQYNSARITLQELMVQATENFFNIGIALRATATDYEQSEAERSRNIRNAAEDDSGPR